MMRKKEKRPRLIGAGMAMAVVAAVCSVVIRVNPVGAAAGSQGKQGLGIDLLGEQAPEPAVSAVSVPTVQAAVELSSLTEQITSGTSSACGASSACGNLSIVEQAAKDPAQRQRQIALQEQERQQEEALREQLATLKKASESTVFDPKEGKSTALIEAVPAMEEPEEPMEEELLQEMSFEEEVTETASYDEYVEPEPVYAQSTEESAVDTASSQSTASSTLSSTAQSSSVSGGYSDAQYLQAICRIEAGTNYEGALAVANCVLNRLNAGYASSVYGVIYAPYQFDTSNMDYYLQNGCGSEVERAVNDALNGVNNVGSYRNFNGTYWLDPATLSCPYVVIGGNVFY